MGRRSPNSALHHPSDTASLVRHSFAQAPLVSLADQSGENGARHTGGGRVGWLVAKRDWRLDANGGRPKKHADGDGLIHGGRTKKKKKKQEEEEDVSRMLLHLYFGEFDSSTVNVG